MHKSFALPVLCRYALVFLNTGSDPADVICDAGCVAQMDIAVGFVASPSGAAHASYAA